MLSMFRCLSLVLSSLVYCLVFFVFLVFFFKQKTAYEMRISDWSSDVCSSDLTLSHCRLQDRPARPFDRLFNAAAAALAGSDRPRACSSQGAWISRVDPPDRADGQCGLWSAGPSDHQCLSLLPAARGAAAGRADRREGSSEDRRVGKEFVSPCSSRGLPFYLKN